MIIQDSQAHSEEKLKLIGLFIQEFLVKNDYAAVEQFIQQWGVQHDDVMELKAVSANDVVLAHYVSKKPAQFPHHATHEINLDSTHVKLEMIHDIVSVKSVVTRTILLNIVALVIFILAVGGLLWYTLQKTALIPMGDMIRKINMLNATLEERVKSRTAELNQKNIELKHEISGRKRIENMVKESEEKYRHLYNNAPDMYHTLDKNGIVIECNDTECKMLGYEKEEIIGKPIENFMTEKSQHLLRRQIENMKEHKIESLENQEREYVRNGGLILHVSVNVFAEYDENGGLLTINAILRDITLQKKMEDELMKMEKLESLGILAGGIAHDFNNLLTSIVGNVDVAKMHAAPEGKVHGRLIDINKAVLQAKDLTYQLLTFAKGGAPVRQVADLRELIEDSICFATRGSNVACNLHIDDDLWSVEVDIGQMHQALNNLIINAQQAMPEGGTLNVRAENIKLESDEVYPLEPGQYMRISVKDFGKGISEEDLEKIFDPFYTTKEQGSGLGLATAFSIVKRHSGYLKVQSEKDVGTTFTIYLPATLKHNYATPASEDKRPADGRRILLMDDEIFVRDAVGEMLTSTGYSVVFAEDGTAAIRLYKDASKAGESFDAVIMDLTIQGGMGGLEAVKKLLDFDPTARVIVASGYSNDDVMSSYKSCGFQGVLLKPFDIDTLNNVLQMVLTDYKLRE
jgi:PAS domain S-box-containing protein